MKARRSRRWVVARALAARSGALLAAIILLAAVLGGGRTYFFCPVMQVAMATSCCAGPAEEWEHADDADATERLTAPDCCIAKRTAKLPTTPAPSTQLGVPASPVVASIPALPRPSTEREGSPQGIRALRHVRAGPGARAPARRRADLMSWIC